jgi:glutathione S-transferase
MITLFNATMTRSTRVLWLLEELRADYRIEPISIARPDGSGGPDTNNPHPLKQVPVIEHDGNVIVESVVIWLHLIDQHPEAGLAPSLRAPERADFMSWLGMATAVVEPLITAHISGAGWSTRQQEAAAHVLARVENALERTDYLTGRSFQGVDLIYFSLLRLCPPLLPSSSRAADWQARIAARPALARARAKDSARE